MRTVRDFLDHLQLEARNRWREVESPMGPLWALLPPGIPADVEPVMAPIPEVGEHKEKILAELRHEEPASASLEHLGSLEEVRESIDGVDREIVRLLAEREGYVRQAARFKETREEVEAPKRVEQVIEKVRDLAGGYGANPDVVESIYRAMISRFIGLEMDEHDRSQG
jgi:isochorismate pyruvate lyase